ncbi:MAG: 6-pyruvoyl tetrahydrobiopterin synthase, partial [Planctomycetes bacterium RBG_16_64_10]
MPESYRVRVAKDDLVFSAAHFITYGGNRCEPLHGHNYRVAAEVFGPLDQNHYVVDFLVLHDVLKAIIDELDHRVLLPTDHRSIQVTVDGAEVRATFEDRRWVFPRAECTLLPVANTTSELLARHIGLRLLAGLEQSTGSRPPRIRIALDDCLGQT